MADHNHDIGLMAHLMRRAGFGAKYDELEARAAKGYDATVDELLNPEQHDNGMDLDIAERCFIEWSHATRGLPEYIAFRMINSKAQLEEKNAAVSGTASCALPTARPKATPRHTRKSRCSGTTAWAASATCWWRSPATRR